MERLLEWAASCIVFLIIYRCLPEFFFNQIASMQIRSLTAQVEEGKAALKRTTDLISGSTALLEALRKEISELTAENADLEVINANYLRRITELEFKINNPQPGSRDVI